MKTTKLDTIVKNIIADYLSENRMFKTLSAFNSQNYNTAQKISRSNLLSLLSITNLYINEKNSSKPSRSILQLIVNNLHQKTVKRNEANVNFHNNHKPQVSDHLQIGIHTDWSQKDRNNHQGLKIQRDSKFLKNIYGKIKQIDLKKSQTNQQKLKNCYVANIKKTVQDKLKVTPQIQINKISENIQEKKFSNLNQIINKRFNISEKHIIPQNNNFFNEKKMLPNVSQQKQFLEQDFNNVNQNINKKDFEQHQVYRILKSQNKQSNYQFQQQFQQQKQSAMKIIKQKKQNNIKKQNQSQIKIAQVKSKINIKMQNQMEQQFFEIIKNKNNNDQKQNLTDQQKNNQNLTSFKQSNEPIFVLKPEKQHTFSVNQIEEPPTLKQPIMRKIVKRTLKQQHTAQFKPKFQFKDHFEQEVVVKKQKYQYETFSFLKFVPHPNIQSRQPSMQILIDYSQRLNPKPILKKKERSISTAEGQSIERSLFQGGVKELPKAWQQGFILSQDPTTFYGLKQIQGGPCGIIAAVQCYFLKHLLYHAPLQKKIDFQDKNLRENCLVAAIADLLFKCSSGKVTLVFPNQGYIGSKFVLSSLNIFCIEASSFQKVFEAVWNYRNSFIGASNFGVTLLLYSIILTKTPQKITQEIDSKQIALIGQHGHCTQQLVNLFITGVTATNCFDGIKDLQSCKLKGIEKESEFGFLTVFQSLGFVQVGSRLKSPLMPIWIISKEFHYHVVFGNHYLIAQPTTDKFDLIYYDGLYNAQEFIRITLGESVQHSTKDVVPLIEKVLATKWGYRNTQWNGSIKIL